MIRMLATRYRLPYRVEYEPTLSLELGSDLFVEVTAQSTLVPDAIDRYDDFLFQLCVLSSSGALGGDTVAPWDCGTSMAELHMATGNRACWRLKDWKTDNRAMLVLAHAFLASQDAFPITRLVVSSQPDPAGTLQGFSHDPAIANPYPAAWPSLPFLLHYDEHFYGSFCLYIDWGKIPTDEEKESITSQLSNWAWATSYGMYPMAPLPPDECSMLFDEDDIEWVAHQMEFPFSRFRAHEGAISALINVCAALHQRELLITKVAIE